MSTKLRMTGNAVIDLMLSRYKFSFESMEMKNDEHGDYIEFTLNGPDEFDNELITLDYITTAGDKGLEHERKEFEDKHAKYPDHDMRLHAIRIVTPN